MHDETKVKVESELENWEYLCSLPDSWHGFQLDRTHNIIENMYDICSYHRNDVHQNVILYFHEETHEYKVRLKLGLIEFVRIEFIASKLKDFEKLLNDQLEVLLLELSEYDPGRLSSIVLKKGITEWEDADKLPEICEGFTLFVKPQQPTKINNGSYIIIDYVDFDIESDFTIYYNIYRDEFFGEARIRNIPDVSYEFDSSSLEELGKKLHIGMKDRLQEIRRRANE